MPSDWLYSTYVNRIMGITHVDIYFIQVLTGEALFHGVQQTELGLLVVDGLHPTKPENALDIRFSHQLWLFIQCCWDGHTNQRPKVVELVKCLAGEAARWDKPQF